MVKMKAPQHIGSVAIGKVAYLPKKGHINADEEHVEQLRAHGFMTEIDEEAVLMAELEAEQAGPEEIRHPISEVDGARIDNMIEGAGD